MQARSTDMLRKAEPTLMTICESVSRIRALVASTSRAFSAKAWMSAGTLRLPLALTLSMMAWHLEMLRDAIAIRPSSSLCCAHLWATTLATPPAPMIRTFFFNCFISPLSASLRKAGQVVVVTKFTNHLDGTVELFHYDGRHFQAVEPVFLDHGVARGVDERQPIADGQRTIKLVFAEDVPGQAGFAAHHDGVFTLAWRQLGVEAIDQQVQQVGFDGAVDHGEVFAVVERVEHGDFQRSTVGDRRFSRLQVDLHAVLLGERLQTGAERVDGVAFAGEVDAAAEADPLDLVQQRAEAFFDGAQHLVEQAEIAVLAVVVEHETRDLLDHAFDLHRVPFAQTAERARRVGQQVVGAAHLRVDAQAAGLAFAAFGKALQLADGVEDDLVAVIEHLLDLIVSPGHAVRVRFAFELLATQLELVQRRRGSAVHVFLHQVEYRPGGEALEGQQGLGAGLLAHVGDLLHVDQKLLFVDEVVRRFDHFQSLRRSLPKKDTHCARTWDR